LKREVETSKMGPASPGTGAIPDLEVRFVHGIVIMLHRDNLPAAL